MKRVLPILALLLAAILAIYVSSCNFRDEPVEFLSAIPPAGSTLQKNDTIFITFNGEPTGLTVSNGTVVASGVNAIISGPFTPGQNFLILTWENGSTILDYTVEGEDKSTTPSTSDQFDELIVDPSLILSLSFDELAGDSVIDDSLYGNDGILVGNPWLIEGKFGNALAFNGRNDWVKVPHDDSLTVDKDVTVMAWIKTSQHTGPAGAPWQGIIAKGNNPRSYSFYTEVGGGLHLSVGEFQGAKRSKLRVRLNQWQHVVAQVDSSVHRYWINGESAGNFVINAKLPGRADRAAVLVGNSHENARTFRGLIDEVRIWNRALSEDEILEQMR